MFNTLNLETLQQKAPSIFSVESAARTSNKYQHISTIQIIERLIKEGFMPTSARQSSCRLADKRNHAKHVIRFRHENARPTESGLFPKLVLVNSHDGLSSYRLMAGLYRLICSNGLVAGKDYEEVRVRHQGDIIGDVIEGTYEIIDTSREVKSIDQNTALNRALWTLAEKMMQLKTA